MTTNQNSRKETLIICCGLTNAYANPDQQFVSGRTSVGRKEIERLMGLGRDFGLGPLPGFLASAVNAKSHDDVSSKTGLIMIQPLDGAQAGSGADEAGNQFPPQLDGVIQKAHVIQSFPGQVPWKDLDDAVKQMTGHGLDGADNPTRFLVVGLNTEGMPFAIASHLRNALGFEGVAVCSHLLGSAAQKAHFAMLRHTYPHHRIEVLLDVEQAALFAGMNKALVKDFALPPCRITPEKIGPQLGEHRRRIIELLCMHWSRCELKPLAGGYSGSLLFLADGWKENAKTEPMVLKVDNFDQMNREITGYFEVKDLLGKHIPTFGHPITMADDTGVGMELATMDGSPDTLQDAFEAADVEKGFSRFKDRLDRSLSIISQRLYANTQKSEWISPYRRLGLNDEAQVRYLKMNGAVINGYLEKEMAAPIQVDIQNLATILTMISANDDGIDSETCVSHGDLNYQNVICDRSDNVWFIDWTHCGRNPVELDFAKLESDVKFVISKDFNLEDLPNLKKFEEFLLSHRIPPNENHLPQGLDFVKWDLRYRKILASVRRIRTTCFALKKSEDWLVYRIALLRYALHTLSFDKRRNRGECEVYQLGLAMVSCQILTLDLVSDDFHLKIRGERPESYPPRQRISIDESPWRFPSPEYAPPYHVDQVVLDNFAGSGDGAWADPEKMDFSTADFGENIKTNDQGRPLHPRGRTGIAGRGLLGKWGANMAANAVIFRWVSRGSQPQILLGHHGDPNSLWLPKGFVPKKAKTDDEILRIINREFGWAPEPGTGKMISKGFSYDFRQTDNAWLEVTSFLFEVEHTRSPEGFDSQRAFEEVSWWSVSPELLKNVNPSQVAFVARALDIFDSESQDKD